MQLCRMRQFFLALPNLFLGRETDNHFVPFNVDPNIPPIVAGVCKWKHRHPYLPNWFAVLPNWFTVLTCPVHAEWIHNVHITRGPSRVVYHHASASLSVGALKDGGGALTHTGTSSDTGQRTIWWEIAAAPTQLQMDDQPPQSGPVVKKDSRNSLMPKSLVAQPKWPNGEGLHFGAWLGFGDTGRVSGSLVMIQLAPLKFFAAARCFAQQSQQGGDLKAEAK
ncbi:hypothetical protein DFH06DRAFT_1128894 [Mycena polygramma]|nr:hypothetical protein DFH06DRAFT_1128894 [Mycena polygramma]